MRSDEALLEGRHLEKNQGPQLASENGSNSEAQHLLLSTRGDEHRHQQSGKSEACWKVATNLAAASVFWHGAGAKGTVRDLTVEHKEVAMIMKVKCEV